MMRILNAMVLGLALGWGMSAGADEPPADRSRAERMIDEQATVVIAAAATRWRNCSRSPGNDSSAGRHGCSTRLLGLRGVLR